MNSISTSSSVKAHDSVESNALADSPRTISTVELFQGADEITLKHQDRLYTLRITRAKKLILTA